MLNYYQVEVSYDIPTPELYYVFPIVLVDLPYVNL